MTTPPPTAPGETAERPWFRRRWVKLGLAVLIPAGLGLMIGRSIWTQWDQVTAHPWRLHAGWLLASAALAWVVFIWINQLWRILVGIVGGKPLGFVPAYRISALSNLGKYLPGKVWAMMGMVYLLRREGYVVTSALAATVLHQAYTVSAGLILLGSILGAEVWGRLPFVSIAVALALSAFVLYTPLFFGVLNWGLRLLKREPVQVELSFPKAFALLVAYACSWILYGLVFWCMLKGVGIDGGPFWHVVASFGAAYLIGFLALFAPGGLGVREGILAMLLTPHLGAGLAALVSVVARLWMTLNELLELTPVLGGLRQWLRRDDGPNAGS